MSDFGAIVVGRGKDPREAWKVGDATDVYVLAEPLPLSPARAVQGLVPANWHAVAEKLGPTLRRLAPNLPEVKQLLCHCPGTPRLARVVEAAFGQQWALIHAERVPPAFRNDQRPTGDLAWPLHTEPTGYPHVEITSCKRCGARWVIALTDADAVLVRVTEVRHNGRVAP